MRNSAYIILLAFFIACEESEGPAWLPLTGKWTIERVVYDGSVHEEWNDLEFVFEQHGDSSGIYLLPQTPYDTLWKSSGTWHLSKSKNFVTFDNSLDANYEVTVNHFDFVTYLPWTSTSTCENGICLPIVTGQWNFTLKR